MPDPWLQDPDVTLYHGDCLDVLRQLPDRSVHMCATSPPFYGLRDYGTGEWGGGDPDCDHIERLARQDSERPQRDGYERVNPVATPTVQYRATCGKCGARRVDQQIGLEETPDMWVDRLVQVFREVRRVLRDDGTLWVEIGDSYSSSPPGNVAGVGATSGLHGANDASGKYRETLIAGHATKRDTSKLAGTKPKDLLGQPWLLAFALRADGWYLRSEIIWARPNPMPESVTDRPTKSHSTVFLLSKAARYFYDADAIREPHADKAGGPERFGRIGAQGGNQDANRIAAGVRGLPKAASENGRTYNPAGANARSVWQIPTEPTPYAHFATWPQALVRRMILAGTSEHGCCSECGAPWVRDVERGESDYARIQREQGTTWNEMDAAALDRGTIVRAGEGGQTRNANGTVPSLRPRAGLTVGWRPSCLCGAGDVPRVQHDDVDEEPVRGALPVLRPHLAPVPAVVLDPFAGSGTTNLVARNHGRHSIGIELNKAYLEIAARRLQQLSLLADA